MQSTRSLIGRVISRRHVLFTSPVYFIKLVRVILNNRARVARTFVPRRKSLNHSFHFLSWYSRCLALGTTKIRDQSLSRFVFFPPCVLDKYLISRTRKTIIEHYANICDRRFYSLFQRREKIVKIFFKLFIHVFLKSLMNFIKFSTIRRKHGYKKKFHHLKIM